MSPDELQEKIERARQKVRGLEEEIGKVFVGQTEVVRETIVAILAGGCVLFEGVPGLGKTLLVRSLARAIGGVFSRIQFTPDLMPADITGSNVLIENENGRKSFEFQKGPIFANVVLADEINRATPKTQSALLEAMQERSVTVGGETRKIEGTFFVLATQNPLEMEGTYPLPEAQLDRFFCKVAVPYPSVEELIRIVKSAPTRVQTEISQVMSPTDVQEIGALAEQIPIADELVESIVRVVRKTRPEESTAPDSIKRYVRYGCSPRAALALTSAAKVSALLAGRYNVSAKDVVERAPSILRHRIVLNFEGQAEGVSTDSLVADVLAAEKR
ncbi:MAG: MoxR family ATPase [Thermoguttaceae bacterium]|nr:MoxR family ATPase [Thermoguttaceae bacterium]